MTSIQRDFARALDDLLAGSRLRPVDVDGFADLDREHARQLQRRWPEIPEGTRGELIRHVFARSLAETGSNFDRLALVATEDSDALVRRVAVAALWESTLRESATRLLHLLESDADEAVRAACCSALARWVVQREFDAGDLALGDMIVESLGSRIRDAGQPVDVRAAAIMALAPRTLPWVATLLREAYYDEDRATRLAALVGMGLAAQSQWLEYIYEQLQSEDPEFRRAAATACGEVADEDAVDRLADALDDEDAAVVTAALDALAEIGGELAAEYLEAFRRRVPEELSDNLEAALAAMREMDQVVDSDPEDDW